MNKPGITVACVACHQKKLLSFEAAAGLEDMPFCDRCSMPMVVERASTKRTKGKSNAQKT